MVDDSSRRMTVSVVVMRQTYAVTFDPDDALTGVRRLCAVAADGKIPWVAVALLKSKMLNIKADPVLTPQPVPKSRLK